VSLEHKKNKTSLNGGSSSDHKNKQRQRLHNEALAQAYAGRYNFGEETRYKTPTSNNYKIYKISDILIELGATLENQKDRYKCQFTKLL
jgi:hypothetical protein